MYKNTPKPQEITQILNGGGVVIFPTETLYGLGCDATNPQALLKIYQIKSRQIGKAFPIVVKDFNMLADYAQFTPEQKRVMVKAKQLTTFILKAKNLSPLAAVKHTAAFRIAKHRWIKELFRHFDKPIVATSANVSGKDPLRDPRDYKEMFKKTAELIDAVIHAGINKKTKGSRIVDLTKKPYKIVRQ
ncbi:MAG: L-threonylcarbamoyladenylate synthase [bacterium]|nr:L-threonylcarbamoyladenylate synthase [bacterium]